MSSQFRTLMKLNKTSVQCIIPTGTGIKRVGQSKKIASLTVWSSLESEQVAFDAVDSSVERLDSDFVASELFQVSEDVHRGRWRVYRHLGVVGDDMDS